MITIKFNLNNEYAELIVNNQIVNKYYSTSSTSILFFENVNIKDGDTIEIIKKPINL